MLSQIEIEILENVKKGNPYYFMVLMSAGIIMVDRVKKYSGENHPYFNFADVARRMGMPMDEMKSLLDVFTFYREMKESRLSASGGQDFSDESTLDTYIDRINYLILEAGVVMSELTPENILNLTETVKEEGEEKGDRTISIDFDGVLNDFKGWTGKYESYPLKEGARDFIERLSERYRLVILTARPTEDLPNVIEWLREHDLLQFFDKVSNIKEPAIAYIDDRGCRFEGHYHQTLDWLYKKEAPYWASAD